jgi:hypothetical protein
LHTHTCIVSGISLGVWLSAGIIHTEKHRRRRANRTIDDSSLSEREEPLLVLLLLLLGAGAGGGGVGAAPGDGVGSGKVLGDELLCEAAPDLHPHAPRLVQLAVVAAAARGALCLPACQLLLDAVHQARQLPHRSPSSAAVSLVGFPGNAARADRQSSGKARS